MNVDFSKKEIGSIFLIVCLMLLLIPGSFINRTAFSADADTYKNLKLFNQVLDMVEKNYVEEIDSKEIIEGAINGMMKSLDPHSLYLTPEMYKDLEVSTKGVFGGLGIEISMVDDIITVISPLEDTPAYRAGLKAGDQIIKIEGESTKGYTIYDAVHKLRGKAGTKVTITIMREEFDTPKDVEITRDNIKIKSVKYQMYEDAYGYIRLSSFQQTTARELRKALGSLEEEAGSLSGLILDMRNNPGGLLNQAVDVSDIFLKSGVIVSSKGRIEDSEKIFSAQNDGDEIGCPIVVLINGGTASASEIVAGALRDNERAVLLGTRSFGKGSVQVVTPLSNGAALKLTIAKYYTPSGKSIQAKGIEPDIIVEASNNRLSAKEKIQRLREKDLKGHIEGEGEEKETLENENEAADENEPAADEKDEQAERLQRDSQLKSAIDVLKSWQILKQSSISKAVS